MYYHWLCVLSALSTVLLAHLATPPASLWDDIRVMHTWNSVPANWESLGPPPAGTTFDLHIALKPQNESALIDALYEVSTPTHRKYGAHLTKEQVSELVAPHRDTLEIVHSWLGHHGVPSSAASTSHGGGWLTITGVSVSQADELLSASYQLYRHNGTSDTEAILRTVSYALPVALHAHVQTVAPTTYFTPPRTLLQIPGKRLSREATAMMNVTSEELVRALSRRDDVVTPSFLRSLYKTQAYAPAAMDRNAFGALGTVVDFPTQASLTQFMTDFRTDAEAATFTVVEVEGGGTDYDPNESASQTGQGSVFTQYAEAMIFPTPYILYSIGDGLKWSAREKPAPGDAYLEWLNYLLGQPEQNTPQTISVPFGNPESQFPRTYIRALCSLFAQLGLRGVSVIAASGDDGVGRDCIGRFGQLKFEATFPACCPWVTGVGGTTGFDPEGAAAFSGGGFSRHFTIPRYQRFVVPPYLQQLGSEHAGRFPASGRGIPDVSAQAHRFLYIHHAFPHIASGTICSTSTVAGIIALLNDYRISNGKPALGFLNPWLYKRALDDVNDITSGSNPGCGTPGFSAIPGWDPVTGLGTLDFEKLQEVSDRPDSDTHE